MFAAQDVNYCTKGTSVSFAALLHVIIFKKSAFQVALSETPYLLSLRFLVDMTTSGSGTLNGIHS